MGMVQLQVINKIIQDRDSSIILLNNLNDTFFCDYKKEFNFILDHYNTYGVIPDKETFFSEFDQLDYLDVQEPINYLIDKLYDDKKHHCMAEKLNKVRELLMNDVDGVKKSEAILTSLQDDLKEARKMTCVDLIHDRSRYDTYIDRCNNFNEYYVTTGFKELDEIIGGWDRKEELATIVARPNVGKSWILLATAKAAAEKGLTVGIYSGEMTANNVGYRFDTLAGHISNSGLLRGNSDLANDYKFYMDSLEQQFPGKLKVLTPDSIGGPAGVNALRAFIEKEHLDMLCVDQHSLLEDDRHGKSDIERASNVSKDLKNLQVMMKIPIISVSQQNRTSTENGVSSSHVARSDRISQDSTIVLFIERANKINPENPNKEDNHVIFTLVKSRNSVNSKKLTYIVDFDTGKFDYYVEGPGEKAEELRNEYEYTSATNNSSAQVYKNDYTNIRGENIFSEIVNKQ